MIVKVLTLFLGTTETSELLLQCLSLQEDSLFIIEHFVFVSKRLDHSNSQEAVEALLCVPTQPETTVLISLNLRRLGGACTV
jgi:hypothetical protein